MLTGAYFEVKSWSLGSSVFETQHFKKMQSTETQILNGNKIKGAKTTDFLSYTNIILKTKIKIAKCRASLQRFTYQLISCPHYILYHL